MRRWNVAGTSSRPWPAAIWTPLITAWLDEGMCEHLPLSLEGQEMREPLACAFCDWKTK